MTQIDRLVEAVNAALVAGQPLIREGCLTRAVTLYWFLSRWGVPVELCFGLATDGRAVGHAWLVQGGLPFLETEDPFDQFTVTYRLPAARP